MKYLFLPIIFLATARFCHGGPLRLQKRAAFYIANETACVVDSMVYSNGDPIPTDDPCEACKCRPPGFACVLKECEVKPGCRAVRRTGHCCPEYICETNTTFGADTTIKIDSNFKITTDIPAISEATQLFEDQTKDSNSEVSEDEVIGEETPSEPAIEPENPDPIHFIPDTIREDLVPETQERGSSSSSETSEAKDATTQSFQNTDSAESQDDAENDAKISELLNTDSEINKENVEEPEKPADEVPSESTVADSEASVPSETTVSKVNVEIFADEKEATTATQDVSSSDPQTTEAPTTKHEIEIETNTIEKRFRSLENATSETGESEITEIKEQLESGKPVATEVPETVISTKSQEEIYSTLQDSKTSTQIPQADSSLVDLEVIDTIDHSNDTANVDKSSERLYYNAEGKLSEPISLGTVTVVVHVNEETSSEKDDIKTSTSVPPSGNEQTLYTQADVSKGTTDSENVNKEFSEILY